MGVKRCGIWVIGNMKMHKMPFIWIFKCRMWAIDDIEMWSVD